MSDVQLVALAAAQFNRISRGQLQALGMSDKAIDRRIASGRLVIVEQAVFGLPPVLDHDPWGRWMAATLTAPGSILSRGSAAAAWGILSPRSGAHFVTRPGDGGPERFGGVVAHRSTTLDGDVTELRGIPITTVPRTILDVAASSHERMAARAVREAVRLNLVTLHALADSLGRYRGRRGAGRVGVALARYAGLPIERARSGAEVRALEILRDAGRELADLNRRIAGEEADLSWARRRLIVEIDGGPFHLDVGEDARKQEIWEGAGWTVRRLPADAVHHEPHRLLALAPPPNVAGTPL